MARPALNVADKRGIRVNILHTERRNKRIAEQAEGGGLRPANWIWQKVFTARFPVIIASPVESALYRELHFIGNNLNQAVKLENWLIS